MSDLIEQLRVLRVLLLHRAPEMYGWNCGRHLGVAIGSDLRTKQAAHDQRFPDCGRAVR